MSAAEIIEMIEKLSAAEQEQVRVFLTQKAAIDATKTGGRRMTLEKAAAIGEGVFDRHPELFRKLSQ